MRSLRRCVQWWIKTMRICLLSLETSGGLLLVVSRALTIFHLVPSTVWVDEGCWERINIAQCLSCIKHEGDINTREELIWKNEFLMLRVVHSLWGVPCPIKRHTRVTLLMWSTFIWLLMCLWCVEKVRHPAGRTHFEMHCWFHRH